uniref:cadherin-17-like n=1 Tax=Myxine glutinosa TaxID=7769 RepID=UPI00358F1CFB
MELQQNLNWLQARLPGILLVWFCVAWSSTATSSQVITVKENYEGNLPHRIGQIGASVSAGTFAIQSGAGNEFGIENTTGWLLALKSFDREAKDVYLLQVMVTDDESKPLDGPIAVQVQITDDNDHKPIFEKKLYEGSVRQKSRPGMAFMQVTATDDDQPNTTNTDLRFTISKQMPPLPADDLFQVDRFSGKISISKQGYKLLDHIEEDQYTLMLTVKDKGDNNLGNTDLTEVRITLLPNLWVTPEPVEVLENYVPKSPILKVQWNDNSAHFKLREKKHPQHSDLFGIDEKSGEIFVHLPLDREQQDEHILLASALDEHGVLLDKPLVVVVIVEDANDNTPHFDHQTYCGVVQETAESGTFVAKVSATDADNPATPNADIRYSIVAQDPPRPKETMFSVDPISGRVTLSTVHVDRGQVNRYRLTVMVRDMGGDEEGLNDTCQLIVDVIDDNDHAPVFNVTEYGPLRISEDSPKGTKVVDIAAWDADEFGSKSWQVIFNVSNGDPDGIFNVSFNLKSNQGRVQLAKRLDFETKNEFNLTLTALNMVPLVEGSRDVLSKAHVQIIVTDANDAPEFSKSIFLIEVLENVTVGSTLLKVTANDPDIKQHDPVKYSLDGDHFKWFTIDKNGVIKVVQHLDREKSGPAYSIHVIAADGANALLTSEAEVNVTILDVNDNAPNVLGDASTHRSLCHKRWDGQTVTLKAQDADGINNSFPFTFSLISQDHVWAIKKHNHSHAKLSLNASEVAEGEHVVLVVVSDSGKPTQRSENPIKVYACQCDEEGECIPSSQQLSGGQIAGICFGVLLGIGAIVAVVLLCLKGKKQKKKQHSYKTGELKDQPHDEVPLKVVDEGKNDVPASPYAVEIHPE